MRRCRRPLHEHTTEAPAVSQAAATTGRAATTATGPFGARLALDAGEGVTPMARKKSKTPKAKKVKAVKRPKKPKVLVAEWSAYATSGMSAELVVRFKAELAKLPSDVLSEPQKKDVLDNLSVATDEAAKPKVRKSALKKVTTTVTMAMTIAANVERGIHAAQEAWNLLQQIGQALKIL
jgi:hypothetical protein